MYIKKIIYTSVFYPSPNPTFWVGWCFKLLWDDKVDYAYVSHSLTEDFAVYLDLPAEMYFIRHVWFRQSRWGNKIMRFQSKTLPWERLTRRILLWYLKVCGHRNVSDTLLNNLFKQIVLVDVTKTVQIAQQDYVAMIAARWGNPRYQFKNFWWVIITKHVNTWPRFKKKNWITL